MRRSRSRIAFTLGIVCAVVLSACGSDGKKTDTTTTLAAAAPTTTTATSSSAAASTPESSAPSSDPATTEPPATDAPTTTVGAPTGDPIVIGSALAETGIGNLKAIADGFEAFEKYANTAGGFGGRPGDLKRCDTQNDPQKATDCARGFADDSSMVIAMGSGRNGDVLASTMAAAADPMAYLCPGVSNPSEGVAPNSFCLYAGSPMGYYASMVYMKDTLHLTKGQFTTADSPAGHATAALLKKLGESLGLTINDSYFATTQADFLPVAQEALSSGAEFLLFGFGVPGELAMAQALATLGSTLPFGTWSALMPTESLAQLKDAKYTIVSDAVLPDAKVGDDPELTLYRQWMESAGYADEIGDSSLQGWMAGRTLQIAIGQLVTGGTEINRANLLKLLRTGTFDVPLFADSLSLTKAPKTEGFSSVAGPTVKVAVADGGLRKITDISVTLP
jgi:ABC-type branched-subunit amino acid transport system substrate-binding protein